MATGCHDDERKRGDDLQMTLKHEDRLRMLTEGSFRCRPCSCGNSDPLFIELDNRQFGVGTAGEAGGGGGVGGGGANGGDVGGTTGAQCFKCRKCNKPYPLLTSSDEEFPTSLDCDDGDDDDGLDFAGIECCRCRNVEPDCFSIRRHDNGNLHCIKCLVCGLCNSFCELVAPAGEGPTSNHGAQGADHDAAWVGRSEALIECGRCPNNDVKLFLVTYSDKRIHKVTCQKCGHGNTFHNQPKQGAAKRNDQTPGHFWDKVMALGSAVWALAPPISGVAQNLAQNSVQTISDNIENHRPVAEGVRQVAVEQLAEFGGNVILNLGGKYLKKLLPMIPEATADAVTKNLSEVVRRCAMQLLAAGQKNEKIPANPSANPKPPANG